MGRKSRDKGAAFEREVAQWFAAISVPAKRGLGQARAASEVPDVDVPGLWIECKRYAKSFNPVRALRQAEKAALAAQGEWDSRPRTAIAICRNDREEATWTMRAADGISWHGSILRLSAAVARLSTEVARLESELAKARGGGA